MLVVMAHRAEQVREVVVVQPVVHVAPVAPCPHQSQRAQQAEVVRGRADAELGGASELLDGPLTREQLRQQSQAPGEASALSVSASASASSPPSGRATGPCSDACGMVQSLYI